MSTTKFLKHNFFNKSKLLNLNNRQLWEWVNMMFNKVDEGRRKEFGPDRTCAEWVLRNGGIIKWKGAAEYLRNYNELPLEGTRFFVKEIDATDSSISHYGFKHFEGCKYIDKVILHQCGYIEDVALKYFTYLSDSLKHLQISSCRNVTCEGLYSLESLKNLNQLILHDLPYVKEQEKVFEMLKIKLPNCKIQFN